MTNVWKDRLYVGGLQDRKLVDNVDNFAIVSCVSSLHYQLLNKKKGELKQTDSEYILWTNGDKLMSLNWFDGSESMYDYSGVVTFELILDFIADQLYRGSKVLIHCNQGLSRSPSVALLYLAKRAHMISSESYDVARSDFEKIYPEYAPKGIADYLRKHWDEIT